MGRAAVEARVESENGSSYARAMADKLAGFRDLFMNRVREINSMTARDVMAAVENISAVVDVAGAHIGSVKAAVQKLESRRGQLGIASAIERQGKMLTGFLDSVTGNVARQENVAKRAQEHLSRIAKASRDTAQLVNSAKLLAVNARIEAARVGGTGNCFSTIAGEMQQLAEHITQANEFIDSLAAQLARDLPEVAVNARTLRELCSQLGEDMSVCGTQVSQEVANLQEATREVLNQGDTELDQMLQRSQRALSHLQFQDVVAQGLGRLESGFVDLQTFHAEHYALDESIAQAEHSEIGGEKDVDQANAGEVTMF